MSAKIACPHCAFNLSLKTIKAGRFKLTCTECKRQFALVIEEGDPPGIRTRKLPDEVSLQNTIPVPPATGESVAPLTKPKLSRVSQEQTILNDVVANQDLGATVIGTGGTVHAFSADVSVEGPRSKTKARPTSGADSSSAKFNDQATTLETLADAKTLASATPERLGGYRILSELGRGGMGSVYLARQLTLNRKVALKTIQAAWASNPVAIARFIREAYAAAQLTHHNVVQIYDLGEEKGVNFFSMELVSGGSLDELLRKNGKVEPRAAASYILQAARGLKFAHDHGMVHRDVKPANLMLTTDSLVKVADLGLVKTPGLSENESASDDDNNPLLQSALTQVTGAGSTMGTPAYMSPEQAEDATKVDHRADIYSLGCTFYALLVGRSPFSATKSAVEMISKHKTERIERPDKVIKGVPAELGSIVERMTQRRPEDRYQDLAETIADLSKYLGDSSTTAKIPNKDHAVQIETAANAFNQVPSARLRMILPLAFYAVTSLVCILFLASNFRVAFTSVFIAGLTTVLVGAVSAVREGSSLIGSRLRAFVFASSIGDWLLWTFGVLMALLVIYAVGMIGWFVAAIIISAVIAGTFHGLVVSALKDQRVAPLTSAEDLLKVLRLGGMEESGIQRFVAEFGGKYWEELFECLFGYGAMRSARKTLSAEGKLHGRSRFQPWRDTVIDRLESKIEEARQAKEQKMLAGVERANLKARGVSEVDARQQSQAMAQTMVGFAAANRQYNEPLAIQTAASAAARRERMRTMLQQARSGKPKSLATIASKTTGAILKQLVGAKLRFVVGALMIAGCTLWAQQNNLLNAESLEKIKASASNLTQTELTNPDSAETETPAPTEPGDSPVVQNKQTMADTKPLQLPIIGAWFNSFAPGFIGLMVLGSGIMISGWRYSLFAIPAAGLTLLGPDLGVPSIVIPSAWISATAALLLLSFGVIVHRRTTA
jgi:serine/threonine protein kinase